MSVHNIVNKVTATHVSLFKASFFSKADIFDSFGFCDSQIVFECKASVKGYFQRITSVVLILLVQHLLNQSTVFGITFENHTIKDKVRGAHGQADLLAIMVFPTVFDNDVRMVLEN